MSRLEKPCLRIFISDSLGGPRRVASIGRAQQVKHLALPLFVGECVNQASELQCLPSVTACEARATSYPGDTISRRYICSPKDSRAVSEDDHLSNAKWMTAVL